MPSPLLAGRFGEQLFEPGAERGDARRGDDRSPCRAPAWRRRPRIAPSSTPGFSTGGALAAQERTISAVRSRKARDVDADRRGRHHAEIGQHRIAPADARHAVADVRGISRACAIFSSDEPGSVIATKCCDAPPRPSAACARSKKYCLKMFGSSVLPDLLDTMNSVRAQIDRLSMRRICAGSVESSDRAAAGSRACVPKVSASTSGPRLEPPMPSSSASVKPARLTSAANASRWPTAFSCSSTMVSQPSQLRLVGLGPQRGVAGPQPPDLALLAPVFERRLDARRPAPSAACSSSR